MPFDGGTPRRRRFDEDEEFKRRAHEQVAKLQRYDPDVQQAWRMICDVSRREFNQIYERLDVRITEKGESFYQPFMIRIVDMLERAGVVSVEDGTKVIHTPVAQVPLLLVKSDGGFTYDTSDLAALWYRLNEEGADWIIYVVDSGQSLHFQVVFAAAQLAGWYKPTERRVDHVGFGLVLGDNMKKLKTRSDVTVRLADLLDEALRRSSKVLAEKGQSESLTPEEVERAQRAIAYGAVKFAVRRRLCAHRRTGPSDPRPDGCRRARTCPRRALAITSSHLIACSR